MRETFRISHEFVDYIPKSLRERTIYISIEFATAVHKCFCGCGLEVVTPISPTDWKLIYDGVSISLSRSIGNWSFPCQSHYWIERNMVNWAKGWSRDEIEIGRDLDRLAKQKYFSGGAPSTSGNGDVELTSDVTPVKRWWREVTGRIFP